MADTDKQVNKPGLFGLLAGEPSPTETYTAEEIATQEKLPFMTLWFGRIICALHAMGVAFPMALVFSFGLFTGLGVATVMAFPLAFASAIITMIVNWVKLWEPIPYVLNDIFKMRVLKVINKEGERTEEQVKSRWRRLLIISFMFMFALLASLATSFYSLPYIQLALPMAFKFMGMSGFIAAAGISLFPICMVILMVCIVTYWVLFANDASTVFARVDLKDRIKSAAKKLFCLENDPSLLLPYETLDPNEAGKTLVSTRMIRVRQAIRLIIVLFAIGLILYGSFGTVGLLGIAGLFAYIHLGGAGIMPFSAWIAPIFVLIGSGLYTVVAQTKLASLVCNTVLFAWDVMTDPFKRLWNNATFAPVSQIAALIIAPLLPVFLLYKTAVNLIALQIEYLVLSVSDSFVKPIKMNDNGQVFVNNSPFKDIQSLFLAARFETRYPAFNVPCNVIIGAVILATTFIPFVVSKFLLKNIKLLAGINAENNAMMRMDLIKGPMHPDNALPIIGGGLESGGFGLSGKYRYVNEEYEPAKVWLPFKRFFDTIAFNRPDPIKIESGQPKKIKTTPAVKALAEPNNAGEQPESPKQLNFQYNPKPVKEEQGGWSFLKPTKSR